MQTSFHFLMTMTTCSHARTAAALAEEAGAVNDLHLSAAQQALSNHRQPPASVSQFRSFTARNPTASVTPHRDAASQSLHGSANLGHHESVSGDRFPYHRDSTPECHEPGRFQWFGPEDSPGDDPDDPGDDNNNNNNNNNNNKVQTGVSTDGTGPGVDLPERPESGLPDRTREGVDGGASKLGAGVQKVKLLSTQSINRL